MSCRLTMSSIFKKRILNCFARDINRKKKLLLLNKTLSDVAMVGKTYSSNIYSLLTEQLNGATAEYVEYVVTVRIEIVIDRLISLWPWTKSLSRHQHHMTACIDRLDTSNQLHRSPLESPHRTVTEERRESLFFIFRFSHKQTSWSGKKKNRTTSSRSSRENRILTNHSQCLRCSLRRELCSRQLQLRSDDSLTIVYSFIDERKCVNCARELKNCFAHRGTLESNDFLGNARRCSKF